MAEGISIAEYKFNNGTNTLPTFNYGYNYAYTDVDNGDGTITRTITSDSLPATINFISSSITELIYLDISNITNFTDMFHDCNDLVTVNASDWDTSRVTSMYSMFNYCHRLTNIDVSNWDTSNVTNMNIMFGGCFGLTSLDLSKWDTSKVTDMGEMFANCINLTTLDLNSWDTSKVIYMDDMFSDCNSLTTVNMFNSDVNSINNIITELPTRTSSDPGTLTISEKNSSLNESAANSKYWNINVSTQKITIAEYTFNNGTNTLPTFNDGYDYRLPATTETINVVNDFIGPYAWENMLRQDFTLPISSKIKFSDITKVTVVNTDDTSCIGELTYDDDMYHGWISDRTKFWVYEVDGVLTFRCPEGDSGASMPDTLEISIEYAKRSIDIVDVDNGDDTITRTIVSDTLPTKMNFYNSNVITINYLNTSELTEMQDMFNSCRSLISVNATNWDVSKVTTMSGLFNGCVQLSTLDDLENWDTSNVTDMQYMFYKCSNLTSIDSSSFNTSSVNNMDRMFYDCKKLTSLDLSNFDTSEVTDMDYMFYGCQSLTSLDISSFDTSNVTEMYAMFYNCKNLTSLDVSSFDTSNVTDMDSIFRNCKKLTSLDLSNWDTGEVTDMESMFNGCNSLISVDLSNFNTSNVTDMYAMFNDCTNLTTINMDNSDVDSINNIITELPTRITDSMGTLNIAGIDDISQVDITTANSKYWNIDSNNNSDPETQSNLLFGNAMLESIHLGPYPVLEIYLGDILLYKKH